MSPFGILAMVKGYVVVSVMGTFLWFSQVHRLTGYRLLHFLKDILPFALAAAAVMAVTYLLTKGIANLWLLISVRVVVAALLFIGIMRLAHAAILDECIQFIRRKKS
jgi:mannose/fructose/N-acetylgalactosamine-specific phosphotransferase system component IID